MKIESVKVYTVATPPPHIGGPYWMLVRMTTVCGIEGVGEVYGAAVHPSVMEQVVYDLFNTHLVGKDPHHIERAFRAVYSSGFTQRPDPTIMCAFSGLEIAMWDIVGKAAGKPVYELIGGKMWDKLRAYTYLYPEKDERGIPDYDNVQASVEAAKKYVEQGWTALKFDPLGEYSNYGGYMASLPAMEVTEEFCREIRKAVGNKCDLLLGTHGQMTTASAIRLAKKLEKYDPLWFEEPLPPSHSIEQGKVASATSIPVASGERLCTKYEFFDLLRNGGAAIVQPDLARVGGILEAKKIATIADVHQAQIAPHVYCGPISFIAGLHVAISSPNFLMLETLETMDGFHGSILKDNIEVVDGHVIPPTKPGLGYEVDWDVVEAHEGYDGEKLHLEMVDKGYDVKNSVGFYSKRDI
ncbi:mandelate racemase/muconate lactonizing enzyme family protein [Pseudomonadota bacterium]